MAEKEGSDELQVAEKEAGKTEKSPEWPKYLMKSKAGSEKGWTRRFLTLAEAGRLFDSGFAQVQTGRYVLLEDFTVRLMTQQDADKICEAADKFSGSK